MFYQLSAPVDSVNILQQPFAITVEPYVVLAEGEPGGDIRHLILRRRVADYEQYLPRFDPSVTPPAMTWPANPYDEELRALLQHIESLGSFWLGIRRIHWNVSEARWEPEDDEERKRLQVFSIKMSREYQETRQLVNPQMFARLIRTQEDLSHLVIPMAFYREGQNAFRAHQYVSAFYNFYFYLEDLYGQGKTKNSAVEASFKKSAQVRWAVEQLLEGLAAPDMAQHLRELKEALARDNCAFDVDGVIKLIVKVRGDLHHFSQRSTRPKGHPFNQGEFRTMAYVLFSICARTAAKLLTGTPVS
jgi:hypothetical protein